MMLIYSSKILYVYRFYINKLRSYDLCILYSGNMLYISKFYINELRYYDLPMFNIYL